MSLETLISLLTEHPYLLLFPLVMIEGPLATICAGLMIAGGVMYWPLACVLAVSADLTADNAYYLLGRNARRPGIARLLSRLGLTQERLGRVEVTFRRNDVKALVGAKVADFAAVPVLLTAGLTRMSYARFIALNVVTTLPRSALLLAFGFLAGHQALRLASDLSFGAGGSLVLICAALVAYLALSKWYWKK